jgi:hypothetical protein
VWRSRRRLLAENKYTLLAVRSGLPLRASGVGLPSAGRNAGGSNKPAAEKPELGQAIALSLGLEWGEGAWREELGLDALAKIPHSTTPSSPHSDYLNPLVTQMDGVREKPLPAMDFKVRWSAIASLMGRIHPFRLGRSWSQGMSRSRIRGEASMRTTFTLAPFPTRGSE